MILRIKKKFLNIFRTHSIKFGKLYFINLLLNFYFLYVIKRETNGTQKQTKQKKTRGNHHNSKKNKVCPNKLKKQERIIYRRLPLLNYMIFNKE